MVVEVSVYAPSRATSTPEREGVFSSCGGRQQVRGREDGVVELLEAERGALGDTDPRG